MNSLTPALSRIANQARCALISASNKTAELAKYEAEEAMGLAMHVNFRLKIKNAKDDPIFPVSPGSSMDLSSLRTYTTEESNR